MGDKPLVTVIMAAFNAGEYLRLSIDSVLSQDYLNFELIVVDDGSTDDTAEVLSSYDDVRLKIFHRENSGSAGAPRNVALKHARGAFVFVFDADDIMYPAKISNSVDRMMAHPEVGVLFTDYDTIGCDGQVIEKSFMSRYFDVALAGQVGGVVGADKMFEILLEENIVPTSSVCIRSSSIAGKLGFGEDVKTSEDYFFWLVLACDNSFLCVNESYHAYRVHGFKRDVVREGEDRVKVLKKMYGIKPNYNSRISRGIDRIYTFILSVCAEEKVQHYAWLALKNRLRWRYAKIVIKSLAGY